MIIEEALHAAKSAAEAATLAKSAFLAHMSHDLRTPLNGVLGLTQVLEKTTLDTEQRAMVQQVRLAGHSLLSLINDILDLSKVEANQLDIDRRAFSLTALMAQTESILAPMARAKGLTLEMDLVPGTPPRLAAERLAELHEALQSNDLKTLSLLNELEPALKDVLGEAGAEEFIKLTRGLNFDAALAMLDQGTVGIDREQADILYHFRACG
jgi:signal transduction histidine kinase